MVETKDMDKTITKVGRISAKQREEPVPGTPAERLAMMWPLTVEIAAISGKYDTERRLQRDVTVLVRRKR